MSLAEHVLPSAQRLWADEIIAALSDYIRIPAISAAYEPRWAELGHIDAATELIRAWCAARPIAGMTVERHDLPGRSPLLLIEIAPFGAGTAERTVLLYGHLDKQPEMTGWSADHGPWDPVVIDGRLYGRGGGDDGYAAFAALGAVQLVQHHGGSHDRIVVLVEASEESGSPDLAAYLEQLEGRIGTPGLVLCLDGGCLDYEHLWVTTSLRGLVAMTLTVEVLREGVHSGEASGVVPSSFRIVRQLLDRVESAITGEVLPAETHVTIPAQRIRQAQATAAEFPEPIASHFPFSGTTQAMDADPVDQLLARSWQPTLSVTGADGLPAAGRAGNVLRPSTSLRLSFRLPPTCDATRAGRALAETLSADPPYSASVHIGDVDAANGWDAPELPANLHAALDAASLATWGKPSRAYGEGGSIPFIGMLAAKYPEAQIIVTGVLGPGSNAHGPNEFVDLPTAERLTAALAGIIDATSR